MSKELDKLVNQVIEYRKADIIKATTISETETKDLFDALKERTVKTIYEEISEEIRNKERTIARKELNEEIRTRKIDEIKKLILIGIFVAFLVGLLVNQVTNLISYGMGDRNVIGTVILSIFLAIITIGLTAYVLLSEEFKFIKENKQDEKNFN